MATIIFERGSCKNIAFFIKKVKKYKKKKKILFIREFCYTFV